MFLRDPPCGVNTLVYGESMKNKLTKSDWLEFGLKRLVKSGAGSLKAEPMAKAMDVSRGSFYWHFEDIAAFRGGVLELWRDKATIQVVEALNNEARPHDRLIKLLNLAFSSELDTDRAIRAWANENTIVAKMVAEVDAQRLQYLESLFTDCGFEDDDIRTRATFLYWAFLGQIATPKWRGTGTESIDVGQMVRLLLQKI